MNRSETLIDDEVAAVPVHLVRPAEVELVLGGLSPAQRRFAIGQGFAGESGKCVPLPDADGGLAAVLFGLGEAAGDPLLAGKLAATLPAGVYRLTDPGDNGLSVLAVALGGYRFDRYRKAKETVVRFVVPDADAVGARRIRDGVFLARDLINMPPNDQSPRDLADAAVQLAEENGGTSRIIEGGELAAGFPLIHAVGIGSDRPPCLVDLAWGDPTHPKVTLVGKGIVFDTGGLDIKPASNMLLMKKDMGGAANVLGLASMIMSAGLKLRLRVLIPAAENAISGRAFRPSDVIRSRKGLTVEIGNTDAEGRLVLADALALADEERPDLLVCMATLTGAARTALGPELPPFYCDDDAFCTELVAASAAVHDPLWRMPLWSPYDAWLKSKLADLNNVAGNSYAGSIVAALFLRRFVNRARTFAHFDIFGWSPNARATGPEGGEAQAIRALFQLLSARHG